jgi:hypothetical protein
MRESNSIAYQQSNTTSCFVEIIIAFLRDTEKEGKKGKDVLEVGCCTEEKALRLGNSE